MVGQSRSQGLTTSGPLVTWAVVVLGADDTRTEVIPMPEPLPDKPRIAAGFDFQAEQPDKPRFCSKAAENLHHQFTTPKCTTGRPARYQIVWSPACVIRRSRLEDRHAVQQRPRRNYALGEIRNRGCTPPGDDRGKIDG
jgi:hypothetical protein